VTDERTRPVVPYDALLIVSFGGPEGPDDVLPFMENVTRGRGIPTERLIEVSQHYQLFGGVSPINAQVRSLKAALTESLDDAGITLPIYWGNRNWHPMLTDTVAEMTADGVRHALAVVTSAYSSYSACRQYLEDIEGARAAVGDGAPVIDKVRVYFNHPGFIEPMVDNVRAALVGLPDDAPLTFCAHSVPMSMASTSDYVLQLTEASRLVAEAAAPGRAWQLVFQSKSGAPGQPWLEPDVNDHLRSLAAAGVGATVLVPIGFISDHMEVVYDLDTQAAETARDLSMQVVRAATVGTDPRFVAGLRDLIVERIADGPRRSLGTLGPWHDVCAADCCPAPARPAARPTPSA
jgi:ferrochelatase